MIVRMLRAGLKPDVVIYDALLAVCVGVAQVIDFTPTVTLGGRVQLVRGEGRDVSSQYGREGGGAELLRRHRL
mgnify:CR=1 FL=1